MRVLVADTGPINYLILIEEIHLLPALFGKVILPATVRDELTAPGAPLPIRRWIETPPSWVEVSATPCGAEMDPMLKGIHPGERAAIALAIVHHADLLLMDDRKGVKAARDKGLRVTGTLGILELGAEKSLIDLADAIGRLRRTNFRTPEAVLEVLAKRLGGTQKSS